MSLPGNGIFVVQGEMAMLVTAMRRSTRWGSHSYPNEEYDVLMRTFYDLKIILNQVDDLRLLDPATFLSPFLEVIRSKETTGPVTSLALSAVHKFLSYGLIDPTHPSVPATVEDIADAVTHARFVGTDHSSDGVVLMKILQVLRTLMLSPEGAMLTDESVCEIMLSCFRICFETRLTELLRRNAEQCLRDMTQLIFMRLPQFDPEESATAFTPAPLSLKKRDNSSKRKLAGIHGTSTQDRKSPVEQPSTATIENEPDIEAIKVENLRNNQDKNLLNEAEITIEPVDPIKSPTKKKHGRHSSMDLASQNHITQLLEKCVEPQESKEGDVEEKEVSASPTTSPEPTEPQDIQSEVATDKEKPEEPQEYVNHRGIRFTQEEVVNLQPYGLVCVRELFRFVISLCNPLEPSNTMGMVHLGLGLAGTALEVCADQLHKYRSLLLLIKDPLCRNLCSLLNTERISIFALNLQVSFLLFEALRHHLKFQMEAFFKKLIEIISADTTKANYELKETQHLALEGLAQMFRIPGLCTELYLNYDCDIYCMNIFEELTKLLSKNVVSSTAYNIHTLSLEALMTIIEAIESASQSQKEAKSEMETGAVGDEKDAKYGRSGHISLELGGMDDASVVSDHVTHDISEFFGGARIGRHKPSTDLPTEAELDNIRNMKKWVQQGTELFNQKPEKGIGFLQEHGVLASPLEPREVAMFLRENPDLDKKMIGEYICKRCARGEDDDGHSVLGAFAESFDFTGLRIDQALRLYLETFRLPGEAPLIFLVMERFAERWHSTNGEPFANTDAAFRLAYAVIMLNVDQHNQNAKKLSTPMTMEGFVRNLRGCNGSGDFDTQMLEAIYQSINSEEMVMPAERIGPVRDAYLWRQLQRRGSSAAGRYRAPPAPPAPHSHHARLFQHAAPPTITALSAAFERSSPPTPEQIESNNLRDSPALLALSGLERCAALICRLPPMEITIDTLLLTLCKFTGLLTPQHDNYISIGVSLGQSPKAMLALRRACAVAARHADSVRAAWRPLLDVTGTLFIARLLPESLVEVEDYLSPNGKVSLIRDSSRGSEAGLLSSIYSYIALGESGMRAPTPHEKALIDAASECVAKCNLPALLVSETKFLQRDSLQELIAAIIKVGSPPDAESAQMNPQLEDNTIFFLELLGQTLIQNRDRVLMVWEAAGAHFLHVSRWARTFACLPRALTCWLRTAARLMRCAACVPKVLEHLKELLNLPYELFAQHSLLITCGLYELIKTSAQNVHSTEEWDIVFALLCAAGAGAWPSDSQATSLPSTSSRSEGSEDESDRRPTSVSSESELSHSPQTQGWIVVKNESSPLELEWWCEGISVRGATRAALARGCAALALVVRDVAHVTPYNCRAAVRAVRLFAAATIAPGKKKQGRGGWSRGRDSPSWGAEGGASPPADTPPAALQLLDLMHTLHSRALQIKQWWRDEGQGAEDYDLWEVAWKPLLQGIALFCTDKRKQVADSAATYLQRALLVPGMAGMGGARWEACFRAVLFPLLALLPRADRARAARANTIVCKVFLQHLSAVGAQPTFPALWSRLLQLQRSFIAANTDDPLTEAALESLKNMLLVMDSVRIFSNGDGYNDLWYITWEQIGEFLPTLKDELFPQVQDNTRRQSNLPSHMQPSIPHSLPTLIPVKPNSTPTILPQPQPPITGLGPSPAQNPSQSSNLGQSPAQNPNQLAQLAHSPANQLPRSPVNLSQTPPLMSATPMLVAPTPISGMVPIRNPLYDQAGLTSSVLLQPLNEMISTPIGFSIQPQMPVSPQTDTTLIQTQPKTQPEDPAQVQDVASTPQQSPLHQNPLQMQQPASLTDHPVTPEKTTVLEMVDDNLIDAKVENELYAEYLTNPYNERKDITQEATLYDPVKDEKLTDAEITNPLLSFIEKPKSLSEHTTPMHRNKTEFGSSDNVRQESSIFNFSSYFGATEVGGSEVFDTLLSTQEG